MAAKKPSYTTKRPGTKPAAPSPAPKRGADDVQAFVGRRPGRPAKLAGPEAKPTTIYFRPELLDRVKIAASRAGLAMTDYVAQVLEREVPQL